MLKSTASAVLLTAILAGAVQAAPDDNAIRLVRSEAVPPTYESVAHAEFRIEAGSAQFQLSGYAFRRQIDGACDRAIDGGGATHMTCAFRSAARNEPARLAVVDGVHGAAGSLKVGERTVSLSRRVADSGGPIWSFEADGREVAVMTGDPASLVVADGVSRGTREAVTAAAFILHTLTG